MNKFLLGLVFGTLLGFLFSRQVYYKGTDDARSAADRGTNAPAAEAVPSQEPIARSESSSPTQESSAKEATASAAVRSERPLPDATAAALSAAKVGIETAASRRAQEAAATNNSAAAQRTAIPVPEAIKPFLEKTDTHDGLTLGQLHSKLEEEPDDLAWSYQMELYLQQAFTRPTKSGQPLDVRIIECRATLCEVVGFSPLPNPLDDIGPLMQYMGQQPWWEFDKLNSTAAGDDSNGKFLLFLHRRR
jgi:hypothetical protein